MFKKATKSQIKIRLALSGASGSGKAQPLDALILTPTGWKAMGNIQVGDEVINSQGTTSRVTGVFPQGKKEIYRVMFTDGSSTECCCDHLWLTQNPNDRAYKRVGTVKSLSSIMEKPLVNKQGKYNHYIPMVKPIEFKGESDLPIDPYVLGILLGDGCLQKNVILVSNSEPEIQEAIKDRLPTGYELRPLNANNHKDFGIRRKTRTLGSHYLVNAIRELGLDGKKSYEKFIPVQYLIAGFDVRLAVFQGLLDTDGYTNGSTLEYSTSSAQLAKDVEFLVESFGGRVAVNEKIPFYTYKGEKRKGKTSYRLFLRLPREIEPFRLGRKKCNYLPKTKYQPSRAIVSVEFVGVKEAQCISIDSPDSLYVTDRFILTHNTYSALAIAEHLGNSIALIDTEHGSASRYADRFSFDTCELTNHHPAKYIEAIHAAEAAGYQVIIIDSLTHAWFSELDLAGGRFDGWKNVRPLERKLIDSMIGSSSHIIATMRSKTEWVMEEYTAKDGKTKQAPKKIGTAPIQSSGIEYEFDLAGELDYNHILTISKSRCPELSDRTFLNPGKEIADTLKAWIEQPQQTQPIPPWKSWKSQEDAITWAIEQLPDMTTEQLQQEFNQISSGNGKKAPAWVERVMQLKEPF